MSKERILANVALATGAALVFWVAGDLGLSVFDRLALVLGVWLLAISERLS